MRATRLIGSVTICFAIGSSAQQPGDLDLTFSGDGIATIDFPTNSNDYATCMLVQPDGRIVVGGSSTTGNGAALALARFMPDGSLDNSFGSGGLVTTEVGSFPTLDDQLLGVALQPDGKIVAVGTSFQNGSGYVAAILRYNPDGSLDNSFSGDGFRVDDPGTGSDDSFFAVAIAANGGIVVSGHAQNANGYDVLVGRYTTDGVPDNTFSGDGFEVTDVGGAADQATGVVIQPDGGIVISGRTETIAGDDDYLLARYTTTGVPDSGFGNGGIVTSPFSTGDDWAYALALQPDGKLVVGGIVAGGVLGYMAVARYEANGTLDASFGAGGLATIVTGAFSYARSLALLPDGRIAAGGASDAGYTAAMLLPNGTLDNSFSGDGLVSHTQGSLSYGNAVAVQADGKLLITGQSNMGTTLNDMVVLRYYTGLSIGIAEAANTSSGTLRVGTPTDVLSVHAPESGQLQVFDPKGNLVAEARVVVGWQSVRMPAMASGVYVVKLGRQAVRMVKE